jgi:uncharacterized protein
VAFVVATLALLAFAVGGAFAFTPPPIDGHVTDTAGRLSPTDRAFLNARLAQLNEKTGHEIAVLVVGSLGGETIDDVAYTTFNTWKVGKAGRDNGVLLVIAPAERRVRIETGKGVGGALTDLQSNEIIRQHIAPKLRQNDFRGAIADGTDAIAAALVSDPSLVKAPQRAKGRGDAAGLVLSFVFLVVFFGVVATAIRRAKKPGRRDDDDAGGGGGIFFFGGGGDGGDSFGGGDGGDYSGGGGESGGGGSSDSF